MEKVICQHCRKAVEYKVLEREEIDIIKGKEINFNEEFGVCIECNNEIWVGELNDRNIDKIDKLFNV